MDVDVTTIEVTVTEVIDASQLQAPVIEVDIVPSADSYEVVSEQVITVESAPVEFIEVEVGIPGPPGPPGPATGEAMPYAKRVDFVGDDVVYRGEAEPGSNESDPVWRIEKIVFTGEDMASMWAAGAAFSSSWTNRYTLTYA